MISLLSACNQDDAVKNADKTKLHKKVTTGFVGKPQAPVMLNFEFLNTPKIGEALQILLKFTSTQESEMLKINYTTSAMLDSADAIQQQLFTNVAKGQQQSYVINVVPGQADLSYVNVFVTTVVNGKSQSRAFAIPVSIEQALPNSVKLQKIPQNQQLPAGFRYNSQDNVITMPASESP